MPPRQLTLPSPITRQSNTLCRARLKNGSAIGFRVAMVVASMIKKGDGEIREYEISPNILANYNLGSVNLASMCKAMDEIAQTTVSIWDDETMEYHAWPLFGRATYNALTKKAVVKLNPELIQHYTKLKPFARIPVFEYISLTSVYTQKIYEYLFSWKDQARTEIEIDELHELLNTPEIYRLNFAEFKRRILEPAYVQIHEKTSLKFEYETQIRKGVGKGGKITHLTFIFDTDLIMKMATPQYRFTRLSKASQKAIEKEFIESIENTPLRALAWITDKNNDIYKDSLSAFIEKHPKCQPIKKKPVRRKKKTTKESL